MSLKTRGKVSVEFNPNSNCYQLVLVSYYELFSYASYIFVLRYKCGCLLIKYFVYGCFESIKGLRYRTDNIISSYRAWERCKDNSQEVVKL